MLLKSFSTVLLGLKYFVNILQGVCCLFLSLSSLLTALYLFPQCNLSFSPKSSLKLLSPWSTCDSHTAQAHRCVFPVVFFVLSVVFDVDVMPFPLLSCSSSSPQFFDFFPTLPTSAQCPLRVSFSLWLGCLGH